MGTPFSAGIAFLMQFLYESKLNESKINAKNKVENRARSISTEHARFVRSVQAQQNY